MAHLFSFVYRVLVLFSMFYLAAGHGFVHSVVVGGQVYPGWNPFVDPYSATPPRVVRKVLNDGYVAGNDSDLACHHEGDTGTTALASAPSGSQVIFQWAYWPGDHQGPVSTYMTSCNNDCLTFSANPARWFKVDAAGYDPTTRQWAAANLIANNFTWVSNIPAGLAPGQYLMRNEIIALHSSEPQFYPSCSQVEVTGSGTGVPSDSQLVSMQTLYEGATFPDIYADSVSFTIPGPPPVNFDGGDTPTTSRNVPTTTTSRTVPATTDGSSQTSSVLGSPTSTNPGPSLRCRIASKKLLRRNSL